MEVGQRTAEFVIRGYLYQAYWTVLRWLDLGPDEVLLCEVDEDISRLLFDNGRLVEVTQEQVKDLARPLSAHSPKVYRTLFNFLTAFVEQHRAGRTCRLIFTTSARLTSEKGLGPDPAGVGGSGLIGRWIELARTTSRTPQESEDAYKFLCDEVKALVAHYGGAGSPDSRERVLAAQTYLDGAQSRWPAFFAAVSWNFEQGSLTDLRDKVRDRVAHLPLTRNLPADLFASRLIVEMLQVAGRPEMRQLTPERLTELAQTDEAELSTWSAKVNAVSIDRWVDLEDRLRKVEQALSPEHQRQAAVSRVLDRLETPGLYALQVEHAWNHYFRHRVIRDLFVEPRAFGTRVACFQLRTDIFQGLAELCGDLEQDGGKRRTRSRRVQEAMAALNARLERFGTTLQTHAFTESISTLLAALDRLRRRADASAVEYALEILTGYLDRCEKPLWVLRSEGGRGKSSFVWQVAQALNEDGKAVCLLAGPDLKDATPIEQIVATQLGLQLDGPDLFHEAVFRRWQETGRPFFILIDAINEALCSPRMAADLVGEFLARCQNRPWLRVMLTCRTPAWVVFARDREETWQSAMIDEDDDVVPVLTPEAIECYLKHFHVWGIDPKDLPEDWTDKPLFLRLFCEANGGREYGGPKPVVLTPFQVMDKYFDFCNQELSGEWITANLEETLIEVGKAFLSQDAGTATISTGITRLALDESTVRRLLNRDYNGLYDKVLNQGVIFRVDPDEGKWLVSFAFERVQDHIVAKALLTGIKTPDQLCDDYLTRAASHLPASIIGTALALAAEQNRLPSLSALPRTCAKALASMLDLLSADTARWIEPQLSELARRDEGVLRSLMAYLKQRAEGLGSGRFSESYLLSVKALADAVFGLPLRDRHRLFYFDRELVMALADAMNRDIQLLCEWVQKGRPVPPPLGPGDKHIYAALLLLGSNAPEIRNDALQWIYWYGNVAPEWTCEFMERYVTCDDLCIRERTLAVLSGLMRRFEQLRSTDRLMFIYRNVLDPTGPFYTLHYSITEFGRKILLDHRALLPDHVLAEIVSPPRWILPYERDYGKWGGPGLDRYDEWLAKLVFRRFGWMEVPQAAQLSQMASQAEAELAALGYVPSVYEVLDNQFTRRRSRGEPEFLPFRKHFLDQATWIVLGRQAGVMPLKDWLVSPERPFALASPDYGFTFSVPVPALAEPSIPCMSFPTWADRETWWEIDQTKYFRELMSAFPEEVALWGRVSMDMADDTLNCDWRCTFCLPEAARPVMERAAAKERSGRDFFEGRLFGARPPAEQVYPGFDFQNLAEAVTRGAELSEEEPVVAAYCNYGSEYGPSLLTISPRIIRAGGLVQLDTEGEFADPSGNKVVRILRWEQPWPPYDGTLLLINRRTLEACCEALELRYCFFARIEFFGKVAPPPKEWRVDGDGRRWVCRFPEEVHSGRQL